MTTEMGENFRCVQTDRRAISHKDVGPNENSGFTSSQNPEPLTFYPDRAHMADVPVSRYFKI